MYSIIRAKSFIFIIHLPMPYKQWKQQMAEQLKGLAVEQKMTAGIFMFAIQAQAVNEH
ncbi:hypothetical protein [Pontibacter pamirensis]|uniref:hypothetical protein n=1 Tax=Pontibacter pamirensis TaxID=2562824 RepID=UPI00138A03E5|nr:hypothetical protein [Pontibacter pamirensis]